MQEIVMFVSLPCCGKTTYAQENYPDYEYISRDSIREELTGSTTNFNVEDKVTELSEEYFLKHLHNNKNIVIDNTNLKIEYRKFFFDLIDRPVKLTIIKFDLNTTDFLKRIIERKFEFNVIKNMFLNQEEFTTTEIENNKFIQTHEIIIAKE